MNDNTWLIILKENGRFCVKLTTDIEDIQTVLVYGKTELEKARQQIEAINEAKSPDKMEADELLYQRLCRLMKEEKLFKNCDANRDVLANALGTNFTYLADAIRKYADGITINDFINQHRLRYAAQLFNKNSSL